MQNDFLQQFVLGTFKEELVGLELSISAKLVKNNLSGCLFMLPNRILKLHIFMPFQSGFPPLKLFGNPAGMTVKAHTKSGWFFQTVVHFFLPERHLPQNNQSIWSAEPYEITLQRKISSGKLKPITSWSLIDSVDRILDRKASSDPVKLKKLRPGEDRFDWLEIISDAATIRLDRENDMWSSLTIGMKDCISNEDFSAYTDAFLNALALRAGKRVDVLARAIENGVVEIVHLPAYHLVRHKHMGKNPLILEQIFDGSGSKFLEVAFAYFLEDKDSELMTYLYSVWDAEIVSRESHRLHAAIALEGLSRDIVSNSRAKAVPDSYEQTKSAEEKLFTAFKARVLKSIESNDGNQNHRKRLLNLVNSCSYLDAGMTIAAAGERFNHCFSDSELKLWKKMRNRPVHGKKSLSDDTETDFFTVISMLYRLALSLINWKGQYVPYGSLDTSGFLKRSEEISIKKIDLNNVSSIRRKER